MPSVDYSEAQYGFAALDKSEVYRPGSPLGNPGRYLFDLPQRS